MEGWAEALAEIRTELRSSFEALTRSRGPEYDSPRPVVLARVEDDRSDFPADQRITRALFEGLVATYDPERRVAPVIVGFYDATATAGGLSPADAERTVAGPSHWVGEYLPPLGRIRGEDGGWHLDLDHLNLYGMVQQIVDEDGTGRVDRMVKRGFNQRSIAFIPKTNETGGKPDLWHFAVLGGEQPGIPNMPTLDRAFGFEMGNRSREWKALGLSARALAEVKYRTLSILDGVRLEDEAMTPEDRAALMTGIGEAFSAAVAPLVDSINKSTETQRTALVDLGASLRTEVKTVETKADAAAERAQIAADAAKAKADEAAADALKAADKAKAERKRQVEQRLAGVVKSGRAQPAHVARVAATFEKASDEVIDAALETLEALPMIDRHGSMPTEIKAEGQGSQLVDFEQRYTQPGMGHRLDAGEVEVMRSLMAGVMSLPVAQRKSALNAAIINHYDGAVAGNALGF